MHTYQKILLGSLFVACLPWASAATSQNTHPSKEALIHQLDEERLAYQLYTTLGEVYPDLRQFQNISRSEARHFQALKNYYVQNYPEIEQMELEGDFIHPETQALYDRLYAEGKASPAAALNVGVQVEELDIKDLDTALASTEDEALQAIYKRLRAGSERHLAAFSGKRNKRAANSAGRDNPCDPANCSSKDISASPGNCMKTD
jgi:hypothetical protein